MQRKKMKLIDISKYFICTYNNIDVNSAASLSSNKWSSEASCKYDFSDKRSASILYLEDAGSTNLLNFEKFLQDKV
jgi:hypothetical protein